MNIVVLGLGNILLCDEGIGVRTIEALQQRYVIPEGIRVIDGGVSAMEMLEDLENLDLLLIVDAVRYHQAPGEMVTLRGEAVPAFFKTKVSPHQVGLSDVLATLSLTGKAPKETVIFGVKPVSLDLSLQLSAMVAERIPDLLQALIDELAGHGISLGPARPESHDDDAANRSRFNII